MPIDQYTEYEFTANDLDSLDSLTDVISVKNVVDTDDVFNKIQNYIDTRHPITMITGNTWEVESVDPTGLQYTKNSITKERVIISPRLPEYEKNGYPLMNVN